MSSDVSNRADREMLCRNRGFQTKNAEVTSPATSSQQTLKHDDFLEKARQIRESYPEYGW